MLRVALLTVMEPAGANPAVPRGLLEIGGASVVRHQLVLALSLGCRKVICVARELGQGMLELQHEAERGGAQFHLVSGVRQLAGLVSAADELIVLGDGVLAAPVDAAALLEQGPAVLVQPIEAGLAAGFERLDINHAVAGAMRIPGGLVERLFELPPDCDIASALTRIALQSGVRQRMVPPELRDGACWHLVRDDDEAHRVEEHWVDLHLGTERQVSPGSCLARFLTRCFGPMLLHAGSGARAVILGAGGALALAFAAAWIGYPVIGFVLLGLAWLARRVGELLSRVERDSLRLAPSLFPREAMFGVLVDLVIVLLVAWSKGADVPATVLSGAFAPLMLVGVLRILPRGQSAAWQQVSGDRLVLCFGLAIAAGSGVLGWAVKAVGLAILGLAIAWPAVAARLTRP